MTRDLIMQVLTGLIQLAILGGLGYLMRFLAAKVGETNLKKYYDIAKIAVNAIEQTMGGQSGANKKQEVIAYIQKIIGNRLSAEEIDKLIEAAVFEMKLVMKDYSTTKTPPVVPVQSTPVTPAVTGPAQASPLKQK